MKSPSNRVITLELPTLFASCVPYTPGDAARVVNSDELIARRGHVEVRLFLVDEERVRHPYVLYELRPHGERLHPRPLAEGQPRVRPELSEVEVQREVLTEEQELEG